VDYDERIQIMKFNFLERADFKQEHSDGARPATWEETCQASEGTIILEEFLNSGNIFNEAIIQHMRRR
jgi:hypothetical protein